MSDNKDYTDKIVIALSKAHGFRKTIANSRATNIGIVGSVQNNPSFAIYTRVGERH